MIAEIARDNGVEMTRQQHEAVYFADAMGGTGSFIERLEMFLQEMDRRGTGVQQASVQSKPSRAGKARVAVHA